MSIGSEALASPETYEAKASLPKSTAFAPPPHTLAILNINKLNIKNDG